MDKIQLSKKCDEMSFVYWNKVIDAIEQYTSSMYLKNLTIYDNFNFQKVIANELYFLMMNREKFKEAIVLLTYNVVDSIEIPLNNEHIRQLLRLMYPNLYIKFIPNNASSSIIKNTTNAIKLYNNQYPHYNNIMFVSHIKFIKYLLPIYNKLTDCVFVISQTSKDSVEFCKNNSLHYLELEKVDNQVICGNEDLKRHYDVLCKLKYLTLKVNAKNIIVAEGSSPLDEIVNIVKLGLSKEGVRIRTICIQQGQGPIVHNGFRNMSYDYFLAWGDEFIKTLKPFNPLQKFIAVGSHILDIKDTHVREKKSILIVDQGKITFINSPRVYQEFYEFITKIIETFHDYEIIFREHPSTPNPLLIEQIKKYNNVICMNPNQYTIHEVLKKSKIVVGIYSTVLLEALVYDSIPFIFNNTSMPHFEPDLSSLEMGIEVSNEYEGIHKLHKLLYDESYYSHILNNIRIHRDKYFITTGEHSISKIIDIINSE